MYKISDITSKEFLLKTPYATFYKVIVNDTNLVLKDTLPPDWPLIDICRSYDICKNFEHKNIVKVYDYHLTCDNLSILMEDLCDYTNLTNLKIDDKDSIFLTIIELFRDLLSYDLINYDFTTINFMCKDNDIKMIDLDFVNNIKNGINTDRMLWLFERLDFIKNWYNKENFEINYIKKEVLDRWKMAAI